MTWTAPVAPVSGTVITVAWAIANVVNPGNWLRVMTGNADPPGTGFVVVSASPSSTAWGKVTADVLAAGAVTPPALDRAYVAAAGDVMSGTLRFSTDNLGVLFSSGGNLRDTATPRRTLLSLSGSRLDLFNENGTVMLAQLQSTGDLYFSNNAAGLILSSASRIRDTAAPRRLLVTVAGGTMEWFTEDGATLLARLDPSGLRLPIDAIGLVLSSGGQLRDTASPERTILTAAGGRFDVYDEGGGVQLLRVDGAALTYQGTVVSLAGHAHAYVPSTSGAMSGTLTFSTDGLGVILSSGGAIRDTASPQRTLITAAGDRFDLFNEAGSLQLLTVTPTVFRYGGQDIITTANVGAQSVANANTAGGIPVSTVAAPSRIPVSDASGKLDAWVTPASFSIPSGTGIWVRTASEIPTGFARETALDGLLLIGAGTSFSQTFNETQTYGNTWQHAHTDAGHVHGSAAHAHGASSLGIGGTIDAASGSGNQANVATPNPASATQAHTHGHSLDVTGSTDGASLTTNNGTAAIGNTTWLPPMRAVVWARKT